jgi:hypothetical protein
VPGLGDGRPPVLSPLGDSLQLGHLAFKDVLKKHEQPIGAQVITARDYSIFDRGAFLSSTYQIPRFNQFDGLALRLKA